MGGVAVNILECTYTDLHGIGHSTRLGIKSRDKINMRWTRLLPGSRGTDYSELFFF
jgi:hypothetical protein